MRYKIIIDKNALKELEHLPVKNARQIDRFILSLELNPRPFGYKKLKGGCNLFRIRVGDYRIVYSIQDSSHSVEITRIAHRKDVYR